MEKMFRVLKREYLSRVKKKGFILSTILVPLLLVAIFAVLIVVLVFVKGDTKTIAVVDETGMLNANIVEELDKLKKGEDPMFNCLILEIRGDGVYTVDGREYGILEPDLGITDPKKIIIKKTENREVSGFIYIPADAVNTGNVEYYTKNVASFSEKDDISDAIRNAFNNYRIKNQGWDKEEVDEVQKRVDLQVRKPTSTGEAAEVEEKGQTFALTFIMTMLIYIMMLAYGSMVMMSVIKEKESRIVEIILSSVRPFQFLSGKLLGVGLVGLSQFLIWVLFAVLLTVYSGPILGMFNVDFDVNEVSKYIQIPTTTMLFFVLFFLLGYFLYASLYAAIGAMVNTIEEAQQISFPVTILIILAIVLMQNVLKAPDSSFATVVSMIPFFSPILMFVRIGLMMPPWYEVWGSIALMVFTIVLILWLSGKIFRVGILMYGKRPSLPELMKWIKYS